MSIRPVRECTICLGPDTDRLLDGVLDPAIDWHEGGHVHARVHRACFINFFNIWSLD